MQKAGTTALASFLNQHPAVYVVDGKEAHIFDHPNINKHPNTYQFIQSKYKEKLKNLGNQRVICDATPITIYQERFLQTCYRYNPNAKFIVMLREPVARAVSHYNMSKSREQEKRSMLSAFLLEPFRLYRLRNNMAWDFDSPQRNHSYLNRGLYSKQLKTLYKLIPNNQILVLHQEDLKHKHKQILNQIYSFLNIQQHPIQQQSIFESPPSTPHWADYLAKLYAKTYYFMHSETPKNWQKITNNYRKK